MMSGIRKGILRLPGGFGGFCFLQNAHLFLSAAVIIVSYHKLLSRF
jgi:hypothetical protein